MRKINRIINVVLIFMLFLGGGIAYSSDISCLRVPLIDDKREEEALKTLADEGEKDVDETSLLKGKKILIVQDDDSIYIEQKIECAEIGAKEDDIIKAVYYQEAIKALQKDRFDLVLLDMGFPDKDLNNNKWAGIDVLEYMVKQDIIMPVLVYSSRVDKLEDIIMNINSVKHQYLFNMKDKLGKFIEVFKTGESHSAFPKRVQSLLQRNNAISIEQKFPSEEALTGL